MLLRLAARLARIWLVVVLLRLARLARRIRNALDRNNPWNVG